MTDSNKFQRLAKIVEASIAKGGVAESQSAALFRAMQLFIEGRLRAVIEGSALRSRAWLNKYIRPLRTGMLAPPK